MNDVQRARLVEVAEWLEGGAEEHKCVAGFNMCFWTVHSACGTLCCIGGAIQAFNYNEFAKLRGENCSSPDFEATRELVGLSEEQANALFFPDMGAAYNARPQRAARVVRHLIETGEVDWSKAA